MFTSGVVNAAVTSTVAANAATRDVRWVDRPLGGLMTEWIALGMATDAEIED
jgi:hypothetical protein